MSEDHIKTSILQLLQQKDEGLATPEIYTQIGRERHTVAKYLEQLHAEGLIQYRQIGKTKLWTMAPAPLLAVLQKDDALSHGLKSMLSSLQQEISIISKDHKVIWSNTSNKTHCFEKYGKHEVCSGCPAKKVLTEGKTRSIQLESTHLQLAPLKDAAGKTIAFIETRTN